MTFYLLLFFFFVGKFFIGYLVGFFNCAGEVAFCNGGAWCVGLFFVFLRGAWLEPSGVSLGNSSTCSETDEPLKGSRILMFQWKIKIILHVIRL